MALLLTAFASTHAQTRDTTATSKDSIYTNVEIQASFPGGNVAWLRYLNKNLRYPDSEVNAGIQGTVIVQFDVDKMGQVSNIHAIDFPKNAEGLKREAERLIRQSRLWMPAILNGRQVSSRKQQPIVFKLGSIN
jgi:periplasmic protein TonB